MTKSSDILKIRDSIIYNSNVKSNIKIAALGDFHLSSLVGQKDVDLISQSLYEEKPNYICILGDLVDSPLELEKTSKLSELKNLIKNSASIAPTFIVLGSHDFIDETSNSYDDILSSIDAWNDINKITNAYVLNDAAYSNDEIFISGYRQKREVYYNLMQEHLEDSKAYYSDLVNYPVLYENLPINVPKIFLTHSPEPIHDRVNMNLLRNYNIIMTGHYHNGCVPAFLDDLMPRNRGIITPRKRILPKYARGIFMLETGTYLLYNGGWVKLQECAPKVLQPLDKLCNRQMDVITLTSDLEFKKIKIDNKKKVLKLK